MVCNLAQYVINLGREITAPPFFPASFHALCIAGKTQAPMGETLDWYNSGVMGPMLEHLPVTMQQMLQGLGAILLAARPQDHVMCAGKGIHAVKLYKAQIVDHALKIGTLSLPGRACREPMSCQKQVPCCLIGKNRNVQLSAFVTSSWRSRTCRNASTRSAVTRPIFKSPFAAAMPPNNRHSTGNNTSPKPRVVKATSEK